MVHMNSKCPERKEKNDLKDLNLLIHGTNVSP